LGRKRTGAKESEEKYQARDHEVRSLVALVEFSA
jgi:hypothetical protein